jgi:hypothetical protein
MRLNSGFYKNEQDDITYKQISMEYKKPKFRGKFKLSICKWLRFNRKIYTENEVNRENDWDE